MTMKFAPTEIDYRNVNLKNITSPEYRHILLLGYWPLFGFLFWFMERIMPVSGYHVMYHPLDSLIPFCEIFVFPYVLWYFYLIFIHVYTFFYDVDAFKKLMKYIVFTYTAALLIFFMFPTCQLLRPAVFERQNLLTDFMGWFYTFDTNTNVCPSLHVVGSFAVMHTAWNTKGLNSKKHKIIFGITTFFISISTVFLKQHSVIDIVAGFALSAVAYYISFGKKSDNKNKSLFYQSRRNNNRKARQSI